MAYSTDYVQQLAEYLIKNLSKGYTLDSLKTALETQGYSKTAIGNAIDRANGILAKRAPLLKEKPQISYRILKEGQNPANSEENVLYEESVPIKKESFFVKFFKKIFGWIY